MKKILTVGAVVVGASVSAWVLRARLPDLARLVARASKPAAMLRHAVPTYRRGTESGAVRYAGDRVGSR
jgi:hypothetical protein